MAQEDRTSQPAQAGKQRWLGLWLLCCGVLFGLQEGGQWLAAQPWVTTLAQAWPLWGVGGVVLAVVSNGGGRSWGSRWGAPPQAERPQSDSEGAKGSGRSGEKSPTVKVR